jgi:isochorismate synthase
MIADRDTDLTSILTTGANGVRFGTMPIDVDPLAFVRSGSEQFDDAFYFVSPDGVATGGLGVAARVSTAGVDRFTRMQTAIESWSVPAPFRAFIGFSFSEDGPRSGPWSPFGAAEAVLPVASVLGSGVDRTLLLAIPPEMDERAVWDRLRSLETPGAAPYPNLGDHTLESHPPVSEWTTAVDEAVSAIGDEAFDKVVLTRSVVVRSDDAPDGFDLVSHLVGSYRQCYGFGWRVGGATFLGASPELLVRLEGEEIVANPLAGSARRGEGDEEDRILAEALMRSVKDRVEHRFVVDDVTERLAPFSVSLDVPSRPTLKRMATVQHLSTRIAGTARPGTRILDLIDVLHPTPAVGGTPREAAQVFIDKVESFDRGWYTGGVGWLDGGGDGEVAIALRCALLEGRNAHVFAGAGIVADSQSDLELLETRLKLRPMLELLAAT